MSLQYFKASEFENCSPACELSSMDVEFMERLDYARSIAGVPFKINSAFRPKDYEIKKGRSGTSSHTKGLAVDISCNGSLRRYLIVSSLFLAGFRRIGIGATFIHVDSDPSKPNAVWLYSDTR